MTKHYKIDLVVDDWRDEDGGNEAPGFLADLIADSVTANGFSLEGGVSVYEVTHPPPTIQLDFDGLAERRATWPSGSSFE